MYFGKESASRLPFHNAREKWLAFLSVIPLVARMLGSFGGRDLVLFAVGFRVRPC